MKGEVVKFPSSTKMVLSKGTAGLNCHFSGAVTVSNIAKATGGIAPGNLIERNT